MASELGLVPEGMGNWKDSEETFEYPAEKPPQQKSQNTGNLDYQLIITRRLTASGAMFMEYSGNQIRSNSVA